jgi:UDP-N-acetyl-D-mannosaminuronate dehydrogenase
VAILVTRQCLSLRKKVSASIGFEINQEKVNHINKGSVNIYGLKNWLGFELKTSQKNLWKQLII